MQGFTWILSRLHCLPRQIPLKKELSIQVKPFFRASIMNLYHQDSFETDIYITLDGRIAIKQMQCFEEIIVYLTEIQALQLYENFPDFMRQAQEQTETYKPEAQDE